LLIKLEGQSKATRARGLAALAVVRGPLGTRESERERERARESEREMEGDRETDRQTETDRQRVGLAALAVVRGPLGITPKPWLVTCSGSSLTTCEISRLLTPNP